jgi:hypothetical protein
MRLVRRNADEVIGAHWIPSLSPGVNCKFVSHRLWITPAIPGGIARSGLWAQPFTIDHKFRFALGLSARPKALPTRPRKAPETGSSRTVVG